jgi:hypothetical protein
MNTVCASCQALNRIPEARISDVANADAVDMSCLTAM